MENVCAAAARPAGLLKQARLLRRRTLQQRKRKRLKHTKSLQERLAEFAAEARQEASGMPDGPERDKVLKKVWQAEAASEIEGLVCPPELHAPK